ncbi:MAG: enoyl-CoA hydratase-related protein [Magnetospirillum sp.]
MTTLLFDRPQDGVALLRINRPEARNALNQQVRREMAERLADLSVDPTIRAVVLTGNDKAFAAGADLKDMAEASAIDMMLRQNHLFWGALARFPKPLIAAVNGLAWGGGCELAMHADIIVAGPGSSFAQPEIKVGIMPGAGGTQRLARVIGKHRAMLMALTGQPLDGTQAAAAGLVSVLTEDAAVVPRAIEIAATIAALPPLAVAQIKEVLLAGLDAPLDTALALERKAFQLLFASRDQKEGMQAFLEKRQAVFEGR